MKKLKFIKLFESFDSNTISDELKNYLKNICTIYKEEVRGGNEHLSEYFGDGSCLLEISRTIDDDRIKSILTSLAEASMDDSEGSNEHLSEYIGEDDCNYIANFLGIKPLDYFSDWTQDEEDAYETDWL